MTLRNWEMKENKGAEAREVIMELVPTFKEAVPTPPPQIPDIRVAEYPGPPCISGGKVGTCTHVFYAWNDPPSISLP